jgi:glycosyltransferase involved in cell wall biosynthesis
VERSDHQRKKNVVFVGTVLQQKGVEDLIHAFGIVAEEFPEARLKLIGPVSESYDHATLQPMIAHLQLDGRVELVGFKHTDEIAAEFEDAVMLVLPSYMETSPNCVAEAMVAGVPVVASNVGGIPFMVRDGETGLLAPPKNPKALSEKMRLLLCDHDHATLIAENAKREARDRFNPQNQAGKMLEVYLEVIKQDRRRR